MRIHFHGYEVDIRAKFTGCGMIESKRMNKGDALDLLNYICLLLGEAEERNRAEGYDGYADVQRTEHAELHAQLEKFGLYKNL